MNVCVWPKTGWRTGAWRLQIVKRSDVAGFEVLPKLIQANVRSMRIMARRTNAATAEA